MEGLAIGRTVHLVEVDGSEHAAIVTHVGDATEGKVHLARQPGGYIRGVMTSKPEVKVQVPFDLGKKPYSWHWPERA